ncbi:hypothetical protein MCAP_0176 [Mycoplasma capricolum subsp. capricolum ATCC 27343]|uniref:Uncharacterized protein n=1 Tax=Mycoplasma capricolum subsp. capricolum (strain California kid / ATCC 27343 / NCTC 10154) TaxID=340047 RepID=Q2SSU8_MYCCT|nr:hypothetical protein MCAP_0176 [Mycoplasma capricolum subsp. capricolum ATCC 27343]
MVMKQHTPVKIKKTKDSLKIEIVPKTIVKSSKIKNNQL